MIIVALVAKHFANFEEHLQLIQRRQTFRTLRYGKFMKHLISSFVAFSFLSIMLSNEPEGKTAFPVYKTYYPTHLDQSFLLIFCTHRIVTYRVITLCRRITIDRYREILSFSSI